MELYQLEELAALAEYGSISKAAESVGVSQPAMSRSMKLLEADIGVPIFQRTSNTIELNDTGRLAASKAVEITTAVKKAIEEIREFDRRKKIILVGSVAPAPLWSVISMLSSIETEKTIAGEMKEHRILEDGLRSGTYRYVITNEPLSISGFATVRLGEENLMFLLPSNHRLAGQKVLSFSDLNGENMLLYENIGSWRELPKRKMPLSKFPSFATDLISVPIEGKVTIPISDAEAHEEFYISTRSGDMATLSYLAKHFRAEFRARHTYAV